VLLIFRNVSFQCVPGIAGLRKCRMSEMSNSCRSTQVPLEKHKNPLALTFSVVVVSSMVFRADPSHKASGLRSTESAVQFGVLVSSVLVLWQGNP
jgi:hypothetical protein